MNWYKISQSVKKPYRLWLDEGNGAKLLRGYDKFYVEAVNENQAKAMFLYNNPKLKAIFEEKRRAGTPIDIVVDEALFQKQQEALKQSKKEKEEQIEMRWDLKY